MFKDRYVLRMHTVAFRNYYVKINMHIIIHKNKMYMMLCSFRLCKVCSVIRRGFLERERRTEVRFFIISNDDTLLRTATAHLYSPRGASG